MGWTASGTGGSGAGSAMFRQLLVDSLVQATGGTGGPTWASDTFNVALYDNNATPDYSVPTTGSAYGSGTWATAGAATGGTGSANDQVFQSGQWPQGGAALGAASGTGTMVGVSGTGCFASGAGTAAGTAIYLTAANTASGTACTISNTFGCLVYDNTLTSKRGVCFNYFGGTQSVSAGTFTVVWSTGGVWRITDQFN